jgi:hypothetical protein
MNIQHFSSLADILIDSQAGDPTSHHVSTSPLSSQERSPYTSPDKYEEETFEHESHVIATSSRDYGSGDEHYENTFEETGLSQLEGEPMQRQKGHQAHVDEDYEHTFENEYSRSVVVQNSTPCPSFDESQTSPSRAESKLHEALGSMSVIKPTENIKTFEELAMMSSPSSSSSNSSSSASLRRLGQFHENPHVNSPIVTQPSLRPSTRHPLLSSSESSTRHLSHSHHPKTQTTSRHSVEEGVKSSTPKLFSKVKLMTAEETQHLRRPQQTAQTRRQAPEEIVPTSHDKQSKKVDPWGITTDDLQTMRKTKDILEKIEAQQRSLQDQQTHRMVLSLSLSLSLSLFFPSCSLLLGRTKVGSCSKSRSWSDEVRDKYSDPRLAVVLQYITGPTS